MELNEAIELMSTVKSIEDEADLYTKSELSELLASQVRSFIEDEMEATGDYGELMNAIGEYEAEFGEPYVVEDEPPAPPAAPVVETWRQGAEDIAVLELPGDWFSVEYGYDAARGRGDARAYGFTSLEEAKAALRRHRPEAVRTDDLHTGKWRVRLVREGERYGAGGRFTYGKESDSVTGEPVNKCQRYGLGLPMVEFYDESQDPGRFPGGQFVSSYYASTLLNCDGYGNDIRETSLRGVGLSLYGDIPEWSLTADELSTVAQWMEESIPDSDIDDAYARGAAERFDARQAANGRIWDGLDAHQKSRALQVFSLVMDRLEKAPEAGGIPDKDLGWRAVRLNGSGFLSDLSADGARLDAKRAGVVENYPEFADLLNATIRTVSSGIVEERDGIEPKDWHAYQTAVRGEVERSPAFKELVSRKVEKAPSVTLSAEKEGARGASRALAGDGARDDRPATER